MSLSDQQDYLVEISLELLPKARDLYKTNWPEHVVAYNFLDNMLRRIETYPEFREKNKIYTLNGEIGEHGTVVALTQYGHIFLATLDRTFQKLRAALKLLNYRTNLFMCVREHYHDALLSFINEERFSIRFDYLTVQYFMSKEDALKLEYDLPSGHDVRSLAHADVKKINSIWPHRQPGSEKFLEYMVKYNPSAGIFNENNELVAWCLMQDFGGLLALQVDENHLRKGYGLLVAKVITRKIAQVNGHSIVANIYHTNFESIRLFEKLQFRRIDTNYRVGIEKKLLLKSNV